MKIYQGNGNSFEDRERCKQNGIGCMISPNGCTAPQNFGYFALDNGAYSAFVNGREWDAEAFERYLDRMLARGIPDFIVTPDKVGAGRESLALSLEWNERIRDKYPDLPQYLAVQDGMSLEDVEPVLSRFNGLFVGGTLEWKYATAEEWVNLAHAHGLPCHIGRVGTWQRIIWAMRIGADSIDSSSWPRNGSWHHIEYARTQERLEVA